MRHRHRGYRITLGAQLLLLLPMAQRVPWLLSLMLCLLAIELMVFLARYSPLGRKRLTYGLGTLAVLLEILWHVALRWWPVLGKVLTLPHVMGWVISLLVVAIRKVKALV